MLQLITQGIKIM